MKTPTTHPSSGGYPWGAVLAALVLPVASVQAASFTWDGAGTDSNFSTAANWTSGAAPTATVVNDFLFTGVTDLTPLPNANDWKASSVTFDSSAGSFAIGGAATFQRIALQPGSSIVQNSANNQSLAALVMASSGTVTLSGAGAGSLALGSTSTGGIRIGAGTTATLLVSKNNTVIGNFSESSTGAANGMTIQVSPGVVTTFTGDSTGGLGLLELNVDASGNGGAAATIQANTSLWSGTFNSSANIQSNSVIFAGSKAMNFSGTFTQLGSGDQTLTFNNTGGTTLSGSVIQLGAQDGSSSRTVTLSVGTGATATISGGISGSASTGTTAIVKSGAGQLVLSGNNTYTGVTNVTAGTLMLSTSGTNNIASSAGINFGTGGTGVLNVTNVTGAGGFQLASGQTLQGTGEVTGAFTVGAGAFLAPGSSPGKITFDNNLVLKNGSTSNFEIMGLTSGMYDVAQGGTGVQSVTFGGILNLTFAGTYGAGDSFKIFDFEAYASTFSSMTVSGLDSDLSASFDATSGIVTLVAVPEPSIMGLLGLGSLLGLAGFRLCARAKSS